MKHSVKHGSTNREVSEVSRGAFHFPVGAPPFQHYQLAARAYMALACSKLIDLVSTVHENKLQTMFYGNAITGGVFNINMASSQSAVSSPESEPPKKKWCAMSQTWKQPWITEIHKTHTCTCLGLNFVFNDAIMWPDSHIFSIPHPLTSD